MSVDFCTLGKHDHGQGKFLQHDQSAISEGCHNALDRDAVSCGDCYRFSSDRDDCRHLSNPATDTVAVLQTWPVDVA
jgi:hypothetical protein